MMHTMTGWKRAVWVGVALTLLTAPIVEAGFLSGGCKALVTGSDRLGSPSWKNGGRGTGKLYQDRNTGVRLLLVAALVRNQSGQSRSYSNIGMGIPSLFGGNTQTSTQDLTLLSQPRWRSVCSGSAVAVYTPPAQAG